MTRAKTSGVCLVLLLGGQLPGRTTLEGRQGFPGKAASFSCSKHKSMGGGRRRELMANPASRETPNAGSAQQEWPCPGAPGLLRVAAALCIWHCGSRESHRFRRPLERTCYTNLGLQWGSGRTGQRGGDCHLGKAGARSRGGTDSCRAWRDRAVVGGAGRCPR